MRHVSSSSRSSARSIAGALAVVVAAGATSLAIGSSATAQTGADAESVIELDLMAITASPGSTTLLASVDTPRELVGERCVVFLEARNNSSVHPDNDLLVRSGDAEVVLADVEAVPDALVPQSTEIALGPTITVSLRMGPDGVFSAGENLTVQCAGDDAAGPPNAPPPTTAIATDVLPDVVTRLPDLRVAQPAEPQPADPTFTG